MYVVGAKNTEQIGKIRKLVPNSYLLILYIASLHPTMPNLEG